ncbi:hypothetical protein OSTOST_06428, partial [Ostertagia ostertagi]
AIGGLLIFTSAYAKSASIVTSVSILGGIIAAGVFDLVALLGSTKQKSPTAPGVQALFLVYMIILSCVFIIQFIVAVRLPRKCLRKQSGRGREEWMEKIGCGCEVGCSESIQLLRLGEGPGSADFSNAGTNVSHVFLLLSM